MITGITPRDYVLLILPSGSPEGYAIKGTVGFFDWWNGGRVIGFYTNDPNVLRISPELVADYVRVRRDRKYPDREVYKLRILEEVIAKIEVL